MTKKLILGYEKINKDTLDGYRLNGRVNPSFFSPYNNVRQQNDIVAQNWLNDCVAFNFFPNKNSYQTPDLGLDKNSEFYEIKQINEILPNEHYFYLIHTFSMMIYRFTSHIAISERVRTDAKNGKCTLVFCYVNEGDLFYYKHLFSTLVNQLDIPKQNFIFIHADNNTNNFLKCPFTYEPINIFPFWVKEYLIDDLIEYQHEKLFTCLNRRMREDRLKILISLENKKLINLGFVSCGELPNDHILDFLKFNDDDKLFLKNFSGSSPDNVFLPETSSLSLCKSINYNLAKKSFLTVVTETEARTDEIIYFTEKTFKPILLGHPFILYNGVNALAKLKELGYKTFDLWWDESYDNIKGYENRANKITEILVYLSKKSISELHSIRQEMEEVLRHNQNLYIKTVKNNTQDDELIKVLQKHIKMHTK